MIIPNIIDKLSVENNYIFFNEYRGKSAVKLYTVIELILKGLTGPQVAKHCDRGEQTFNRAIRKLVTVKLSGKQSWKQYFISISDYRFCAICNEYKLNDLFDNTNKQLCKACKSTKFKEYYQENKPTIIERTRTRQALILQRMPIWANRLKIKEIYDNCPLGYHVDHEVPLQGKNVCGLHVEYNLQYLTAKENLSKGNKFS